jgi:hypothetical protein
VSTAGSQREALDVLNTARARAATFDNKTGWKRAEQFNPKLYMGGFDGGKGRGGKPTLYTDGQRTILRYPHETKEQAMARYGVKGVPPDSFIEDSKRTQFINTYRDLYFAMGMDDEVATQLAVLAGTKGKFFADQLAEKIVAEQKKRGNSPESNKWAKNLVRGVLGKLGISDENSKSSHKSVVDQYIK